jgi:hypothetical protein
VSSRVIVEEEADDVFPSFVRLLPNGGAVRDFANLGRAQRPIHPPFSFKFLLPEGGMRPGMPQLKVALRRRPNHVRTARPAV